MKTFNKLFNFSGIVLDFEVYQGSKTPLGDRTLGLGASVVLRLVRTLPNNSSVFFDRYFTTLPLLERLAEMNVHGTGTIQTNRLRKVNLKEDKRMQRGDSDQIIRSDEKIVVVKWRDSKPVTLASTAYGQDPIGTVKRWNKEQKCRLEITCPAIVMEYNKNMGGVDICDQMMECYRTWLKSKKWTLKVALHFLDLSVVNSWMEYRLNCRSKSMPRKSVKDLLSFRLEIAEALLFTPKRKFNELNESSSSDEEEQTRTNNKCSPLPGSSKRLDGGDHWPVVDKLKTARACRLKQCNSRTRTRCEKCDVYLCLTSDKNCFKTFHTST